MEQNRHRGAVGFLAARVASIAIAASTVLLVVFHAALFWRRIAEGTIAEPGVLGRWIVGTLLVGALVVLRRKVWRDGARHGSLVFWLLVAVLHVAIPADESLLTGADLAVVVEAGSLAPAFLALVAAAAIVATLRCAGAALIRLARFTSSPSETLLPARAPPIP